MKTTEDTSKMSAGQELSDDALDDVNGGYAGIGGQRVLVNDLKTDDLVAKGQQPMVSGVPFVPGQMSGGVEPTPYVKKGDEKIMTC